MSLAGPVTTSTVVQGAQLVRAYQGKNLDGTTPTGWENTDTLTASVWLANDETPVFTFTPTWFSASSCQVQIDLTSAQTSSLEIDATYNLQIFGSRSGDDPFCLVWVYLQVLPAAGSATAPSTDLISGQYALRMLSQLALSEAQLEQIPSLITSVSAAWSTYCNRMFWQATYTEDCEVELDGYIRLKNIPINQIYVIKNQPDIALSVINNTAQQAYIGFTVTGDVTSGQTVTGMTATSITNGVTTVQAVTYTSNETIGALATAISALGNGWSANAGAYSAWPVTEIFDGFTAKGASAQDTVDGSANFNVYSSVVTNAFFHPDGGQHTGLVCVGRQYNNLSPRWGPGWEEWSSPGNQDTGAVRVVYNGGFATIPNDVQWGVAEHVKTALQLFQTDVFLKSETANNYSYTLALEAIEMLPKHVRQIMSLYRVVNA